MEQDIIPSVSSEEEDDELTSLEEIRNKMLSTPKSDRMQVSAWEDDDTGVDAERDATEPLEKAFLDAAENNKLDELKRLLSINPNLLTCCDKDGYTALHRACYADNIDIVNYLLEQGARTDAKTTDDWEPLHSACCWNNVHCAEALVENGANVNAKTKGEVTPLHLASAASYNFKTLQYLLLNPEIDPTHKNNSGDTPEDIAKRSGKYYPMFEIIEPCLNDI